MTLPDTLTDIFNRAPFIVDLGVQLVSIGGGSCETVLPLQPRHLQQNGYVHAGVQATLADHTAGAAGQSAAADGFAVLTIEFKINLLRPAVGDLLRCTGSVLRAGRSITVVEAEVYAVASDAEKLCAKATVTLALVPLQTFFSPNG